MYDKILVTLDGSPIAEKVMPWVPVIATAGGASQVTLLTVVEEATPEQLKMSEGYLQNQATLLKRAWPKGFTAPNINVIAVRAPIAGVPGVILRTAEDSDIDLMVLCTHGRSGFDRWSMGSVAEKLLRGADLPLFLVRASDVPLRQPAQIKRILAPVDGSPLAEQALPHVEVLARTPGAQVTILYVEHPPASTSEGAATAGIITQQRRETLAYLKTLLPNLAAAGVAVMHEIRTGHPAEGIVQEIERVQADVVVMSSHGRTGLARAVLGSVADQVLHSSPVPVLLTPSNITTAAPSYLQGPLAYHCHHCGRRTYRDSFNAQHHCARCGYLLKACGNCVNYDGTGCTLQLQFVTEPNPGNRCPKFEFRKTRAHMR